MKKLFVIFASIALVAAFAGSASAGNDDWSLYGNARMATFWVMEDDGSTAWDAEDDDLQWDLQGNSRVGAKVKHENIKGQVELALKAADGGADVDVGTRRIEATWDLGAPDLTIGKTYGPVNQFVSGQVFGSDNNLLGQGFLYGSRPALIQLSVPMFKVALIQPETADAPVFAADQKENETLPKLELSFNFSSDVFSVNVMGGFQSYDVETATEDVSIDSIVFGVDFGLNFGPAYVKFGGSILTNGGNARWTGGGNATVNAAGTDVDDVDSMQYAVVVGVKAGDTVTIEGGYGFREHDSDNPLTPNDEETGLYVQAVLQVSPGVFIIPELGVVDKTGADDRGDTAYFGAKWQINF